MYSCRWKITAMGIEVLEVMSELFRIPAWPTELCQKTGGN